MDVSRLNDDTGFILIFFVVRLGMFTKECNRKKLPHISVRLHFEFVLIHARKLIFVSL